jgi:glutathione synthase
MKNLSLLILTDHSTHSAHNSFYGLLGGFARHQNICKVAVASKHYLENQPFFEGQMNAMLFGYEPEPTAFQNWKWPMAADLDLLDISSFDLVFLRLPEPVAETFFPALEAAFPHTLFINRPSGILKTGSKAYLTRFPALCPPMQVVHSPEEAINLSQTMDIVLKPLRNYGGKGIMKIEAMELFKGNEKKDLSHLSHLWDARGPMLAMKYLPHLSAGDKRTVVAHGHLQFSTVRYPPSHSWICNVAQGGRSEMSSPTPEEKEIARILTPQLEEEGVILFGFDTLMDDSGLRKLSEINVQSIGGIGPAEQATGKPISAQIVDHLMHYAMKQLS